MKPVLMPITTHKCPVCGREHVKYQDACDCADGHVVPVKVSPVIGNAYRVRVEMSDGCVYEYRFAGVYSYPPGWNDSDES